jgi:hypothetical protein
MGKQARERRAHSWAVSPTCASAAHQVQVDAASVALQNLRQGRHAAVRPLPTPRPWPPPAAGIQLLKLRPCHLGNTGLHWRLLLMTMQLLLPFLVRPASRRRAYCLRG